MYGALHFLFGLIIGCYFPLFHAQVLHLHKLSQENCHTNCEYGLINDLDYCNVFVTLHFSDTIPDSTLVYFEVIGEVSQNLFSLDVPSECTGYKQNAKYYCTQTDNNYFNITVIVYAQPKFSKAKFRCYLTNPNGRRVESENLTFPEIQDTTNAKANLQINDVNISTTEDCLTTIDKNGLNLEIDCVSGSTPCFIEIQLNGSVVYKRRGNHGTYSKSIESKEELFINISYAACSLERNFKSITCRVQQDSQDYLKQISTTNDTIIPSIVSCLIVFALLSIAVILYILYRKKVILFKQITCSYRRQKQGQENESQNTGNEKKSPETNVFKEIDDKESKLPKNAEIAPLLNKTEKESELPKIPERAPLLNKTEKESELHKRAEIAQSLNKTEKESELHKRAEIAQSLNKTEKENNNMEENYTVDSSKINACEAKSNKVIIEKEIDEKIESHKQKSANECINIKNEIASNNENGDTDLYNACSEGKLDYVINLIQKGASVNKRNEYNLTPLMIACHNGFIEIASQLISKTNNVNFITKNGWTALMFASANGHLETVRFLIEKGAEVNLKNKDEDTALSLAIMGGYKNTKDLLEKHQAKKKR